MVSIKILPQWTDMSVSPEAIYFNSYIDKSNYNFNQLANSINTLDQIISSASPHTSLAVRLSDISEWDSGNSKWYIKSSALDNITLDDIEDSVNYIRMTPAERSIINSFQSDSFRLQIANNSPLDSLTSLIVGDTLTISQYVINSGETSASTEVKISSVIPIDFYQKPVYGVVPILEDPSNPYTYIVQDGPYRNGSLRVFVNFSRVPNNLIDQTLSSQGKFSFKSNVSLSELPNLSNGDSVIVDFDIPFCLDPAQQPQTYGKWWAFISPQSGDLVEATTSLDTFSLLSSDNKLNIIGDSSNKSIDFSINESLIDHNELLNYDLDRHHLLHEDDQNIWKTIYSERKYPEITVPIPPIYISGSIEPYNHLIDSTLIFRFQNGMLIYPDNADKSMTFALDLDYIRGCLGLCTGEAIYQDYYDECEYLEERKHCFDFRFNLKRYLSLDEEDYGLIWSRSENTTIDDIWATGLKTNQTFENVYIDQKIAFRSDGHTQNPTSDDGEMIISQRYIVDDVSDFLLGDIVGIDKNTQEIIIIDGQDLLNDSVLNLVGVVINKSTESGDNWIDVAVNDSVISTDRIDYSIRHISPSTNNCLWIDPINPGKLCDGDLSDVISSDYGFIVKIGRYIKTDYIKLIFSEPIFMNEEVVIP